MYGFWSRQRVGMPQILAGVLLLVFIAQCVWLIAHEHANGTAISEADFDRMAEGIAQWHGRGIAGTPNAPDSLSDFTPMRGGRFDAQHSPLWYLIGAAPVAVLNISPDSALWVWLARAPYVLFGTLLGASVWYVSRRLYGNAGGYIALALYCFSPSVICTSTLWFSEPDISAAWGTFGAVFTAIAVSHTLYAPREVVLWNWRRILLLGISLALAVGSQFSLALILPLLLGFMLYVAPDRRGAAAVILLVAWAVALLLIFASYFFHPRLFWQALAHAKWLQINIPALSMREAYSQVVRECVASGPVLLILVPAALVTYAVWRRSRYFGNTAPLAVAALFLFLRAASPHPLESAYSLLAVIFLVVFVAGVTADLLETTARELITALVAGLLSANALWNLFSLSRVAR